MREVAESGPLLVLSSQGFGVACGRGLCAGRRAARLRARPGEGRAMRETAESSSQGLQARVAGPAQVRARGVALADCLPAPSPGTSPGRVPGRTDRGRTSDE
ncbi:hypothetical protein ATK36_0965 [Amycolatopsis sulphurea]|uniref:Uncharacterized protein n=1 Tax=Amycolatopsis sulphurea TaxID=76022 RepID=A0A2A9G170_9PSEU|nr:hypothetical protein ATK36_0965 [Amycolatopsis sulphurea]